MVLVRFQPIAHYYRGLAMSYIEQYFVENRERFHHVVQMNCLDIRKGIDFAVKEAFKAGLQTGLDCAYDSKKRERVEAELKYETNN